MKNLIRSHLTQYSKSKMFRLYLLLFPLIGISFGLLFILKNFDSLQLHFTADLLFCMLQAILFISHGIQGFHEHTIRNSLIHGYSRTCILLSQIITNCVISGLLYILMMGTLVLFTLPMLTTISPIFGVFLFIAALMTHCVWIALIALLNLIFSTQGLEISIVILLIIFGQPVSTSLFSPFMEPEYLKTYIVMTQAEIDQRDSCPYPYYTANGENGKIWYVKIVDSPAADLELERNPAYKGKLLYQISRTIYNSLPTTQVFQIIYVISGLRDSATHYPPHYFNYVYWFPLISLIITLAIAGIGIGLFQIKQIE